MELTLLTDTQARGALNLVLGGDLEPYNVASDLVRMRCRPGVAALVTS